MNDILPDIELALSQRVQGIQNFLEKLTQEPDFIGPLSEECVSSLRTSSDVFFQTLMDRDIVASLSNLENGSSIGFLRRIGRGECWWEMYDPSTQRAANVLLDDLERLKRRLSNSIGRV